MNCQFFVLVDEAEELGYFKNNGDEHGRNARLMQKSKDTCKEEVWRASKSKRTFWHSQGITKSLLKMDMNKYELFGELSRYA
ncbi:hypothetical protein MTR_0920s0010 [Medicago truncatula]|uniref:Uncharacterized protein n=1 Tax=Medicago truncatula TaxID=3880 RepID=A0A072TE48_MEDTR|nr:hypothetical protein MTR_0920s0010 [Medicago truncatula]